MLGVIKVVISVRGKFFFLKCFGFWFRSGWGWEGGGLDCC